MPVLTTDAFEGPEREFNRRGLFVAGPQFITPSDVLARLIDGAQLALAEPRYTPNPIEERRAQRIHRGRDAAARNGRRVRPWECVL